MDNVTNAEKTEKTFNITDNVKERSDGTHELEVTQEDLERVAKEERKRVRKQRLETKIETLVEIKDLLTDAFEQHGFEGKEQMAVYSEFMVQLGRFEMKTEMAGV